MLEQQRGWTVAVGSAVGVAFGSTPFFSATFAILSGAWAGAFGWSPTILASAATLFLATQTAAFPIAGFLVDRYGSRRAACASIASFGLLLVVLSESSGSAAMFYCTIGLLGLTTAATNFIGYARAIATWFDRNRGLAFGLTASAQGVGLMGLPLFVQKIIDTSGWTGALLSVAAIELIACLPVVWLSVKEREIADSPAQLGQKPVTGSKDALRGTSIVRRPVFWKMAACIAIEGLSIYAILPNTMFILSRTAGLNTHDIAGLASLSGAAFLAGRVLFGMLLDRVHARWLFLIMLALVAGGLMLYAIGASLEAARLGAFLLGAAGGGQTDLMPYVSSRYFGKQTISTVFGLLLLAFFAGAAVAPVLFVFTAQARGVPVALGLLAALQIVPAAVFLTLGDYARSDGGVPA